MRGTHVSYLISSSSSVHRLCLTSKLALYIINSIDYVYACAMLCRLSTQHLISHRRFKLTSAKGENVYHNKWLSERFRWRNFLGTYVMITKVIVVDAVYTHKRGISEVIKLRNISSWMTYRQHHVPIDWEKLILKHQVSRLALQHCGVWVTSIAAKWHSIHAFRE